MKTVKTLTLVLAIILTPVWTVLSLITVTVIDSNTEIFDAGIVFGASVVNNSYPSQVLKNRLDIAVSLLNENKIKTIVVSGDTRNSNYNEPKVMEEYLVSMGIGISRIIRDESGNRTLESCKNARETFGFSSVILISQDFHLPRANVLCKLTGLRTGIAPAPSSSLSVTVTGTIREYPALIYNLYLLLTEELLEV